MINRRPASTLVGLLESIRDGQLIKFSSTTPMKNEKSLPDVTHNRFFGENLARVLHAIRG